MGCVIFQFHLSFHPSEASREIVEQSAHRLRQDVVMAVEFRCRSWLGWPTALPGPCNESTLQETLQWLRHLRGGQGVILIASDELVAETYPQADTRHWAASDGMASPAKTPAPAALPSPSSSSTPIPHVTSPSTSAVTAAERGGGATTATAVLPTVLTAYPCSAAAYIRVHRREGSQRVLSTQLIQAWVDRIVKLMDEVDDIDSFTSTDATPADASKGGEVASTAPKQNKPSTHADIAHSRDFPQMDFPSSRRLQGPCYVLWGTDFEDHPLINMARLHDALPEPYRPRRRVKAVTKGGACSLQSMFQKHIQDRVSHASNAPAAVTGTSAKETLITPPPQSPSLSVSAAPSTESIRAKRSAGHESDMASPSKRRNEEKRKGTITSFFKTI